MSMKETEQGKKKDDFLADGNGKGEDDVFGGVVTPQRTGKRSRMEVSPTLRVSLSEAEGTVEPEAKKRANIAYLSFLWDEEEGTLVKTPREETRYATREGRRASLSSSKRLSEKAATLIREADKELREIRKVVGENQNTKKEIKASVKKLTSILSQLTTREILDSLEGLGEGSRDIIMVEDTADAACQTEGSFIERAVQTEKSSWQIRNHNSIEDIRARIGTKRGFEGWREVAQQEWPSGVYTVVREIQGNPIWENKECNLAFLVERGDSLGKGIGRQVARRFPEARDLPEDAGLASLVLETKIQIGNGDINSRKTLTRVWVEEEDMATYMNLLALKEKVLEWGLERVALLIPEDGWPKIKKMTEHVFWGTGIGVMAYAEKRKREKEGDKKEGELRRAPRRTRKYDAVVIKAGGKSFAELLKGVKDKVDAEKIGVKITGARSTREGDLLLTTEKDEGKAQILKEEIGRHFGAQQVTVRKAEHSFLTLNIKGLEATATAPEIKAAVRAIIKDTKAMVEVKSLRPAFADRQNATIEMERKSAGKLLNLGRVSVGWAICSVQERVPIIKCTRCWGIGHRVRDCKGPDRSAFCFNCGKKGHKVKECHGESYCPRCDRNGHRGDSLNCPLFRQQWRRGSEGGVGRGERDRGARPRANSDEDREVEAEEPGSEDKEERGSDGRNEEDRGKKRTTPERERTDVAEEGGPKQAFHTVLGEHD